MGQSYLAGNGEHHAFISRNGELQDLNSLLVQGSDWVIETAFDINDSGVVAAVGRSGAARNAVLLVPNDMTTVPEPSAMALTSLALIGFLARMSKRHAPKLRSAERAVSGGDASVLESAKQMGRCHQNSYRLNPPALHPWPSYPHEVR